MVLLKGNFMQDSNSQNNPQTTPSSAPTPQAPSNIYPPAKEQVPTPTMLGTQGNVPIMSEPTKKSSPIPKIIIAVALVIIMVIGGFFFFYRDTNELASFEKTMIDLGYSYHHKTIGETGAYAIYSVVNSDSKIWGLATFYEMDSAEELRSFINYMNNEDPDLTDKYLGSLNWSLDYEKKRGLLRRK